MASNSGRRSSSSGSRPGRPEAGAYHEGMTTRRVRRDVRGGEDRPSGVRVSTLDERPSATGPRRARPSADPRRAVYDRKVRRIIAVVIAVAVALVTYLVVTYSSLFAIRSIVATPTQHIDAQTISQLAAVPEGSTLFSVDEHGIAERIAANPWVASVEVKRAFPSELQITVTERTEAAVVMLSSGLAAWRLSSDGYWLEQLDLASAQGEGATTSVADAARAQASADGVVFVSSVAVTVAPQAGSECTDDALRALLDYLSGFSEELVGKIAQADASSLAGLSLVLDSGVEVSVGPATDIEQKEQALDLLMSQGGAQVTYVNVRNPAVPTWRGLDADTGQDAQDTTADAA